MPRWLVIAVVLGMGGLLVWMLWPRSRATVPAPVPGDVTVLEATPSHTTAAKPMSEFTLEEIRPGMVSYVTQQNGRWVLVFQDGSKREVFPFEINQLPDQLQFQMGYKRGGS